MLKQPGRGPDHSGHWPQSPILKQRVKETWYKVLVGEYNEYRERRAFLRQRESWQDDIRQRQSNAVLRQHRRLCQDSIGTSSHWRIQVPWANSSNWSRTGFPKKKANFQIEDRADSLSVSRSQVRKFSFHRWRSWRDTKLVHDHEDETSKLFWQARDCNLYSRCDQETKEKTQPSLVARR